MTSCNVGKWFCGEACFQYLQSALNIPKKWERTEKLTRTVRCIILCAGTPLTCFYFFVFVFTDWQKRERWPPELSHWQNDQKDQGPAKTGESLPATSQIYCWWKLFFLINTPLTITFTIFFFYCHYKKRNTSKIPVHLSAISKDQVTVMYFSKLHIWQMFLKEHHIVYLLENLFIEVDFILSWLFIAGIY